MEQGWECHKCHNVYAPNTPFCLYCWFQSQSHAPSIEISNSSIIDKSNLINVQEQPKTTIINNEIKNKEELLLTNKDLTFPHVDITLPTLNKDPIYSIQKRWPDTHIYLGGIGSSKERAINRQFKIPYILDSIIDLPVQPSKLVRQYFDYINKNNIEYMLDSSAFSYMNNPKKTLKLTELLDKYCYYINEFDIHNFFELDLDIFMSLDEVENIRKKIYSETHKLPIIVYHENRGHDYWIKMCKENQFIAIGGIVTSKKGNDPAYQKILLDLCDEAHSYGTKVHGLGFTPLNLLNQHTMFFDTVDSTSWNAGKFGKSFNLNECHQLISTNTLRNTFSATEAQEEDLKVWATFATDYQGETRII